MANRFYSVTEITVRTYKEFIDEMTKVYKSDVNPFLSIKFRDMTVRVFITDSTSRDECFMSMSLTNYFKEDFCLMVYSNYFDLKNFDAQWYLLAHEIGHYKTMDLQNNPREDTIRRYESFIDGKVSYVEVKADQYAYQILKSKCIPAMEYIASYLSRKHLNQYGDAELRRRITILKQSRR